MDIIAFHFRDAASKVERANRHLHELTRVVEKRLSSYVYEMLHGFNAEARQYHLSIKIPDMGFGSYVALIVGDVVQNLRSSLDHLAFGIGNAKGLSRNKLSKVYFPFAANAQELEADPRGKIKHLPAKARSMILALQPYGAGNRALWGLNNLSARDKHRLLIPNFAVPEIATFTLHMPNGPVTLTGSDFEANPYGFVGASFPCEGPVDENFKIEQNMKATVQIVFGDVEPFQGQGIIPTLAKLSDEIGEIVRQFAAVDWTIEP